MEKLEVLDLEGNLITGSLPSEFKGLRKLRNKWDRSNIHWWIWRSEGKFICRLISLAGPFLELQTSRILVLYSNLLEEGIPAEFGQLTELKILDVSRNSLSGQIPSELGNCSKLSILFGGGEFGSKLLYWRDFCGIGFSNYSCAHVVSSGEDPFGPYDASSAYLAHFTSKCSRHHFNILEVMVIMQYFIILVVNNFTGNLPPSMSIAPEMLGKQIVYAFLAGSNRFTGPFPGNLFEKCHELKGCWMDPKSDWWDNSPSIGSLVSLAALNLLETSCEGQIPSSLGHIKDLSYLSLAGNNLVGSIPSSFGQLHSLEVLELSSNTLSGEIPNNLHLMCLSIICPTTATSTKIWMKCNSVQGNPFLQSCHVFSLSTPSTDQQGRIGDSQDSAASPSVQLQKGGSSGFNSIEIASITSAAAIVSVLLALIVLFFYTRKWNPRSRVAGSTRKEVTVFTEGCLTFENVPSGKATCRTLSGIQQFDAEIRTLGRLRHPNLVTLIGYHNSETEMFLIYNYLPGGNLEKFIQERSTRAVDWRVLHKIALDIARALASTCMIMPAVKEFFTAGLWDSGPHDDLLRVPHLAICTAHSLLLDLQ
ncbi:hypothetical protein HAX54_039896 [Datura stramonium]|uniref:Protein kinase domain-containing protein n=1 Tax=Datura stramonium TaxID=4076 RepID=A0ABS8SJL7_DATST|nr:hypothetical protein [Datura stramonium]